MIDKLKSIKEFKDLIEIKYPLQKGVKFDLLSNYIDLLYKPLELGMFVPCVDGVPLPEPDLNSSFYDKQIYYQAEKKVLFKGFEWESAWEELIYKGSEHIVLSGRYSKVKDLFKLTSQPIELTEACKQLITK